MPTKPRPRPAKKATKSHERVPLTITIPAPLAQALEGAAKRLRLSAQDLILHLLDLNVAALAAAPRRKRKA